MGTALNCRQSAIASTQLDDAWNGKFAKPAPNKLFEIVLNILKKNGEVYTALVLPHLGCDVRSAGAILGSMVKQRLIKESVRRMVNGKKVQVYIDFNAKSEPKIPTPPKVNKTAEAIAMIEEFLDDGEEIYVAQMVERLDLDRNFLNSVFSKMLRQKIISPIGKRSINGGWHAVYQSYDKKPKQASMLTSFQARRDSLVDALFGSYQPDPEAAWSFT